MKIPKPAYELVSTTHRNKQYWGFARRGSDAITLTGTSKREALRVIHRLYFGEKYIPIDGEAVNVEDVEDLKPDPEDIDVEDVSQEDVLTVEEVGP